MAERKLLSKRGKYAEEKATFNREGEYFVVRKVEKKKDLKKVDKERAIINKRINLIKQRIALNVSGGILTGKEKREAREKQDNLERYLNSQIYGTSRKTAHGGVIQVIAANIAKQKEKAPTKPIFRKIDMNAEAQSIIGYQQAQDLYSEKLKNAKSKEKKQLYESMLNSTQAKELMLRDQFRILLSKSDKAKLARVGGEEEYLKKLKKGEKVPTLSSAQTLSDSEFKNLINEAKSQYALRKPLDEKSKSLRAKEDKSNKKVYDAIRNAKKKHQLTIAIGNKDIEISKIEAIKKGKKILGYKINEDVLQAAGINAHGKNKLVLTVSVARVEKEQITVTKVVQVKPRSHLIFHKDGLRFYTDANIKKLFDNAQKQTGQRIIYLNGKPVNENAFVKENGKWYAQSFLLGEIGNITFEQETFSVALSYTFAEALLIQKTTEVSKKVEPQHATPIYTMIADVQVGNEVGVKKAFIQVYSHQVIGVMAKVKKMAQSAGKYNIVAVELQEITVETMSKSDRERLKKLNNSIDLFLSEKDKKEKKILNSIGKTDIIISTYHARVITADYIEQLKTNAKYVYLIFAGSDKKGGSSGSWLVYGRFQNTEFAGTFIWESP
ncbi:MAG: hypothetical protein ACYCS1_04435 [Gammaproteobacteria bacterium]